MSWFVSTRGAVPSADFQTVLLSGLAPDGGLYVPERWPALDIDALKGKTYSDIAEAVMRPFVEDIMGPAELRALIGETYNENIFRAPGVAPLKEIYPGQFVMELFHGPTIAFKDVALQFLGRLFGHVLEKTNRRITIVGATSGDTGSAAIEGCRHTGRAQIFILFPEGRVSDVQRRQMTTVRAENVHNIAVQGTFDDCQNLVKTMFSDETFRDEMNLSAVNSINWARIMAQIVYYVKAAVEMPGAAFVVPTGNFGNVFAAYAAKKMGAPLGEIAIATNRNDILARFFETGEMKQAGVFPTLSPSMDIEISSNFERYLFEILGRDPKTLSALMTEFRASGKFSPGHKIIEQAKKDFTAWRAGDDQTLATIKKVHDETGYTLDPHTAVGFSAALRMKETGEAKGPVITLATAHPAKFPDAVEKATGARPALPPHLDGLLEKPEFFDVFPNDLAKIKGFITKNA